MLGCSATPSKAGSGQQPNNTTASELAPDLWRDTSAAPTAKGGKRRVTSAMHAHVIIPSAQRNKDGTMRRLLSGLSAIAVLIATIGIADPSAAQNRPQDRSMRNADASAKSTASAARKKPAAVVVNKPPPRNGAYYKGIFRDQ